MTPSVRSPRLCRLMLRTAGLLVPGGDRAEWLAEWEAELWHICRSLRTGSLERDCSEAEDKHQLEPTTFCLGAFQDALWLRRNQSRPMRLPQLRRGSPMSCLLFLGGWTTACLLLALSLPTARKSFLPSPYPDANELVLISPSSAAMSPIPTIRVGDYRSWLTNTHGLFTDIAFYQPTSKRVHISQHRAADFSIIRASANIFDLLKIPAFALKPRNGAESQLPGLILSESAWKKYFDRDPGITGRIVEIAGHPVRIAGVLSQDQWRLPGQADGWMIADPAQIDSLAANSKGFVLAHLQPSGFPTGASGRRWMTVSRANGDSDTFECLSLAQRAKQPFSMYLFTLLLACLALPATTPLPLGEYPGRARSAALSIRIRRWLFLAAKLALILPLVYFASIALAYGNLVPALHGVGPAASQYLQLAGGFFGLLFAFRWALHDQRGRCPVCLRLLTNPAHVGEASRNFLAWNGTELICTGGHGLLHIPELPTSWFSCQRWLYLDPSWSALFADGYVPSAATH
jgi:hypothetical protein